jgi:hypothetical protein
MRWLCLVGMSLMLLGCEGRDFFDLIAGNKYEVAVLAKDPVVLGTTPLVLRNPRPMKVIGDEAMVCLVLLGDVSDRDSGNDQLLKQTLNGAKIDISVKLNSGTNLQFYEPMPAWRQAGRVLKSGEYSGCASVCCEDKSKLPKGSEVSEVRIVSTKPIKVQGIFWESTNAFDGLGKKP